MSRDSFSRMKINPSLLLGFGGQGQRSLVEIRRRLEMTYGSVPPQVKLIAFDTDVKEDQVLNNTEYSHLEVRQVWMHIDEHRARYDEWMDLERIPREKHTSVTEGAGQIRQIGRFALKYHMPAVIQLIEGAWNDIHKATHDDDPRWDTHGSPRQIAFLGSIAGGTGAGTILDLACALRSRFGESDKLTRNAYLVMPGVFRSFDSTHYVEENAYAFLKELDFFLSSAEAIERGEYGERFRVEASAELNYVMAQPFNSVMLVDSFNTADQSFDDPQDLAEAVAVAVFTTLGGEIGRNIRSVLNNPDNQGNFWDDGSRCSYAAFGVAELYYPREEVIAYALANFAEHLTAAMDVGQACEGEEESTSGTLEAFLAEHGLRERGQEHNQIIDAILSPEKRYVARIPDPQTVKADSVDTIWQENQMAFDEHIEAARSESSAARASKVQETAEKLRERVDELLRLRGGNAAAAFVNEMSGYLAAVGKEMAEENGAAAGQAKRYADVAAKLKDECVQKAGKLFGRREAVRATLAEYDGVLRSLARAQRDVLRTGEAKVLCDSIQEVLKDLRQALSEQHTALAELVRRAAYNRERAHEALARPSAFQVPVQPDIGALPIPDTRIDLFYEWLRSAKGSGALDFWKAGLESATAIIQEYAISAYDSSKDAEWHPYNMTLASVLASKSDSEREDYMQRAHRRAEPLLPYSHAKVTNPDRQDQDRPTTIYRIGASEEFFDLFSTADERGERRDLAERLSSLGTRKLQATVIGDSDRAYFFRRFGCIPAHAIGTFDLLRGEYLEHVSNSLRWTLHLDKRWDEILPDLDPRSKEEDGWVWALASSDIDYLRCVIKSGNHYAFEYEDDLGDGSSRSRTRRLGQGYEEARTQFLMNREWVVYAQRRVEQGVASLGRDRVLEDTLAFNEQLMDEQKKAEKAGQEPRATGFERDVDAIAAYRQRLMQR